MLFGMLRQRVELLFEYANNEAPLTTDKGLKAYLAWSLKASEAFGINVGFVGTLKTLLTDPQRYYEFFGVVCYAHSLENVIPSSALPEGVSLIRSTDGRDIQVTSNMLRDWLPFASQLITFVNDVNRMAGR
jgi:hypothetical protein